MSFFSNFPSLEELIQRLVNFVYFGQRKGFPILIISATFFTIFFGYLVVEKAELSNCPPHCCQHFNYNNIMAKIIEEDHIVKEEMLFWKIDCSNNLLISYGLVWSNAVDDSLIFYNWNNLQRIRGPTLKNKN